MVARTNLIAQHSQGILVVDTEVIQLGGTVSPGAPIVHVMESSPLGQGRGLFRVEHVSNGWHRVVSELSDMVFDVAGGSVALGAPIILWPWHGGPNQRFRLRSASWASTDAGGFTLQAEHSGKVLDVSGAASIGPFNRGVPVVQWDFHGGANQRFRVFGSPIKPMHTDLVLDVATGSQANRAPVVIWPLHGGPNQLFRLEFVPAAPTGLPGETAGAYRLVAEHSGKVLEVEGASQENGARVVQWDWHGGPNQLFRVTLGHEGFGLRAVHSRKMLDVLRASGEPGAQLVQWDWHPGPNQTFKL
jgi:hypothetical protein